MTKKILNESTFKDCAFAGCKGENEKQGIDLAFFSSSKVVNFDVTRATSSLIAGIDTIRHIQSGYHVGAFLFEVR